MSSKLFYHYLNFQGFNQILIGISHTKILVGVLWSMRAVNLWDLEISPFLFMGLLGLFYGRLGQEFDFSGEIRIREDKS